jgi:hypothetical protein
MQTLTGKDRAITALSRRVKAAKLLESTGLFLPATSLAASLTADIATPGDPSTGSALVLLSSVGIGMLALRLSRTVETQLLIDCIGRPRIATALIECGDVPRNSMFENLARIRHHLNLPQKGLLERMFRSFGETPMSKEEEWSAMRLFFSPEERSEIERKEFQEKPKE